MPWIDSSIVDISALVSRSHFLSGNMGTSFAQFSPLTGGIVVLFSAYV